MAAITKKVPAKPLKGVAVGEINVAKDGNTVKLWIVLDGLVYETSMVQQSQAPSSGGSGGTTNHAALTNLDYASSGHTGFQASLGFTPAPASSSFVVISLDGSLTSERNLAVGASLSLADSGANAAVTLNTIQDIRTSASPTFASVVISPVTYGNVLSANGTAFVSLTPDAAGLVDKVNNQTGIAGNKTWTGNHVFQTAVDSTTGFQVFDADGGNPIFSVDTVNERVGIGTNSPVSALTLTGPNNTNPLTVTDGSGNGRLIFGTSADSNCLFGLYNGLNELTIYLKTVGDVYFNNTGNFGIATTTPTNTLSFGINASRKIWIENQTADNNGNILTVAAGSCVTGVSASNKNGGNLNLQAGLGTGTGSSTIVFQNGTTLSSGKVLQTMSTKMVILGSGNVGIGQTAPASTLSVNGGVSLGIYSTIASPSNGLIVSGNTGIGISSPTTQLHVELDNSTTSTVDNVFTVGHSSSGTPATGFGCGLIFQLESSTTVDQNAVRMIAETIVATHASRTYRGRLTAYDYNGEREVIRWEADGSAGKLGIFGVAAVVRASALTQTYSTADRTLSAYTADNESGAYSGIDNLQIGNVYAQLTDLNALRTAYENLRAFTEDLAGFVNSLVDDMQAYGLEQ